MPLPASPAVNDEAVDDDGILKSFRQSASGIRAWVIAGDTPLSISAQRPGSVAVDYATTADLASTFDATAQTLESNNPGVLSIDGGTPLVTDLVLAKDQTNPARNYIYEVTDSGTVGSRWRMKVWEGFNEGSEVFDGAQVYVTKGTENVNTTFAVDVAEPFVFGGSALNWVVSGSGTAPTVFTPPTDAAAGTAGNVPAMPQLPTGDTADQYALGLDGQPKKIPIIPDDTDVSEWQADFGYVDVAEDKNYVPFIVTGIAETDDEAILDIDDNQFEEGVRYFVEYATPQTSGPVLNDAEFRKMRIIGPADSISIIRYVDPDNGDDTSNGETTATAWKTLAPASSSQSDIHIELLAGATEIPAVTFNAGAISLNAAAGSPKMNRITLSNKGWTSSGNPIFDGFTMNGTSAVLNGDTILRGTGIANYYDAFRMLPGSRLFVSGTLKLEGGHRYVVSHLGNGTSVFNATVTGVGYACTFLIASYAGETRLSGAFGADAAYERPFELGNGGTIWRVPVNLNVDDEYPNSSVGGPNLGTGSWLEGWKDHPVIWQRTAITDEIGEYQSTADPITRLTVTVVQSAGGFNSFNEFAINLVGGGTIPSTEFTTENIDPLLNGNLQPWLDGGGPFSLHAQGTGARMPFDIVFDTARSDIESVTFQGRSTWPTSALDITAITAGNPTQTVTGTTVSQASPAVIPINPVVPDTDWHMGYFEDGTGKGFRAVDNEERTIFEVHSEDGIRVPAVASAGGIGELLTVLDAMDRVPADAILAGDPNAFDGETVLIGEGGVGGTLFVETYAAGVRTSQRELQTAHAIYRRDDSVYKFDGVTETPVDGLSLWVPQQANYGTQTGRIGECVGSDGRIYVAQFSSVPAGRDPVSDSTGAWLTPEDTILMITDIIYIKNNFPSGVAKTLLVDEPGVTFRVGNNSHLDLLRTIAADGTVTDVVQPALTSVQVLPMNNGGIYDVHRTGNALTVIERSFGGGSGKDRQVEKASGESLVVDGSTINGLADGAAYPSPDGDMAVGDVVYIGLESGESATIASIGVISNGATGWIVNAFRKTGPNTFVTNAASQVLNVHNDLTTGGVLDVVSAEAVKGLDVRVQNLESAFDDASSWEANKVDGYQIDDKVTYSGPDAAPGLWERTAAAEVPEPAVFEPTSWNFLQSPLADNDPTLGGASPSAVTPPTQEGAKAYIDERTLPLRRYSADGAISDENQRAVFLTGAVNMTLPASTDGRFIKVVSEGPATVVTADGTEQFTGSGGTSTDSQLSVNETFQLATLVGRPASGWSLYVG